MAGERLSKVTAYILEHFDQKTKRNDSYSLGERRVRGFNALFATASIEAARTYYGEFKKQQAEVIPDKRLKIGTIFSYAANEAVEDGALEEEEFETQHLTGAARDFLDVAIRDYNQMFGTSFDTSSDKFQNYYKDLSLRMKNREIDLVIVVNMFLTGFDATTLNTLFVDKQLRAHGLIQAYSRTNRILNSVKAYGNIVSFRDLESETNEALSLFGNKDAQGIAVLLPYSEYFTDYEEKVQELFEKYPLGEPIVGEQAKKEFITLFGAILRLQNILTSFDEFAGNEVMTQRQGQDYRSVYLDLYAEFRATKDTDKEQILDDIIFEIELIKQVEINVDYILMLVAKYRAAKGDGENKEIRAQISRAVDASPTLRNKKDLIETFVDSISVSGEVDEEWRDYIQRRRQEELQEIIDAERLKQQETYDFVLNAFREGGIRRTGTDITKVMPPVSRFGQNGAHSQQKQRVLAKLVAFFERFMGLVAEDTSHD